MSNPDFTKGEWAYAHNPEEPVTILTTKRPHPTYTVVAMDTFGVIRFHKKCGGSLISYHDDGYNLVPLKKKVVLWVNEYRNGNFGSTYNTEDRARFHSNSRVIRTIKLVEAEEHD
jgi:hypothetical protein